MAVGVLALAAPADRLGGRSGLRCGRGSRGGRPARRPPGRRAALGGRRRGGRGGAVPAGRTARRRAAGPLPRLGRRTAAARRRLRPARLRDRGDRRRGGLGRAGFLGRGSTPPSGRGHRLTRRISSSRPASPAPAVPAGADLRMRGLARSSPRTRTSTGWTPRWSSRASTRTPGGCASTARASPDPLTLTFQDLLRPRAHRAGHHPDLRLQRGRRPVRRQRPLARRTPGRPAARGRGTAAVPGRPRRPAGGPFGRRHDARHTGRDVMDGRDALLAVGMNGEPLPFDHGFPVRMVVPGLYGYVSACKWIQDIELTTFDAYDPYWVKRELGPRAPIKTAVPHRHPRPVRAPRAPDRAGRRGRLGPAPRHRPGRGPGRRRPLAARPGSPPRTATTPGASGSGPGRPRPAVTPSTSAPPTAPAPSRPKSAPGPSPTARPAGTRWWSTCPDPEHPPPSRIHFAAPPVSAHRACPPQENIMNTCTSVAPPSPSPPPPSCPAR